MHRVLDVISLLLFLVHSIVINNLQEAATELFQILECLASLDIHIRKLRNTVELRRIHFADEFIGLIVRVAGLLINAEGLSKRLTARVFDSFLG